jgi:hypothetical protein
MSYLDVISLERAKNYLRIDEDLTEDDSEITSMINASCMHIEKRTNHILYARDKDYKGVCQVKVYDYPINSIVTSPEPFNLDYAMFSIFPNDKAVTLNVGYEAGEAPDDLIQACLQMIDVWYYSSEKQVNTTLIPMSVVEVVDINRRFI